MSKPPKYNLRQLHLNAEILEERQMLSVVTVSASGDQDGEAFSVLVNGEVEQSFIATEQTQAFQLETGEQLQANDIQIEFVDDGDDSELKIEFVEIDGVRVEDLSTLQAERSSEDVSTSTVPAETQSDSTPASGNRAPEFTEPNDEVRNVSPGESVSYVVAASDEDGDALTWSATGLPEGLWIDSCTGEISGTIADDAAGSFASEITVSDGTDSTTKKVEWVVTSTSENNAPTFTNPNDESRNVSPG
ncbi:MAG: putative Ig domain-containing protein, partial [Planctomycetota bacterium]